MEYMEYMEYMGYMEYMCKIADREVMYFSLNINEHGGRPCEFQSMKKFKPQLE